MKRSTILCAALVCAMLSSSPALCQTSTNPPPTLSIQQLTDGTLLLTWPAEAANYVLERSDSLGTETSWQPLAQGLALPGDVAAVQLQADATARFFRLRQVPFQVSSFTPLDGAADVGSTFRPQVFFSIPVDSGTLNSNNFYASFAGQKIESRTVPANDGSFAWLFFAAPMPGGSRLQVTVDGSTILPAGGGPVLDAAGTGVPGSLLRYEYTTVSLAPLAGTALSGIVTDPGPDLVPLTADDVDPGLDGIPGTYDDIVLLPIAGVQVSILGLETKVVTTGADGKFHFDAVPAGDVKVRIDGRTASSPPAGCYFPDMVMDATMQAAQDNVVMAGMPEVYLARLSTNILQTVSSGVTNFIAVTPDGAPSLTSTQRQNLTLTLAPGSLIGPDGSSLSSGQVGISTVPPEVVRDMLPPGLLQHTFDITVQAPGIATFSAPAAMTFPNVFNAAPGTKLNFLSFDHTTGRLVIEGTATVSADGLSVRTDPGTGVTHPGWHGLTPPGSPTTAPCDPNSPRDQDPPGRLAVSAASDYLFVNDNQAGELRFIRDGSPSDRCRDSLLVLDIIVEGPVDEFLEGLPQHSIQMLRPGAQVTIPFHCRALLPTIQSVNVDRLYGVRVSIRVYPPNKPTLLVDHDIFVYRFLDAADSVHSDGILSLPDTALKIVRRRPIEYHLPASAQPTLQLTVKDHWSESDFPNSVQFAPQAIGDSLSSFLRILTPAGNEVGKLGLIGKGKGQTWSVDVAALMAK